MAMTKRADGRYQKKIILSNGKQKIVYGKSPAAVNAAARALLAEDEAGLEIGDHTLVGEWAKTWLESYKMTLRYSTIRMYRNAYNKHIMPVIGSMELRDVRPVHIRRVLAGVADLSESSQHKVLITARQLFQSARQNKLVSSDPTEGMKITKHPQQKEIPHRRGSRRPDERRHRTTRPRFLRSLPLLRPAQGGSPRPEMV